MNKAERNSRAGLVAAYREGLGLAAVAVICGPSGIRITADRGSADPMLAAGEMMQARWWCRRIDDAERVAAAATMRMQRRQAGESASADASFVAETIARAANKLGVALVLEEAIADEATAIVTRVDLEIARLQRTGELRSVNKAYQEYRVETSARGERVMRYRDWMNKYRENLIRQLAATLRYF